MVRATPSFAIRCGFPISRAGRQHGRRLRQADCGYGPEKPPKQATRSGLNLPSESICKDSQGTGPPHQDRLGGSRFTPISVHLRQVLTRLASRSLKTKKRGKNLDEVKADKAEKTGRYYRLMIEHVGRVLKDVARIRLRPEGWLRACGFAWFQGWNDMVAGGTYPKRGQPGVRCLHRMPCSFHPRRQEGPEGSGHEVRDRCNGRGRTFGKVRQSTPRSYSRKFSEAMAAPIHA